MESDPLSFNIPIEVVGFILFALLSMVSSFLTKRNQRMKEQQGSEAQQYRGNDRHEEPSPWAWDRPDDDWGAPDISRHDPVVEYDAESEDPWDEEIQDSDAIPSGMRRRFVRTEDQSVVSQSETKAAAIRGEILQSLDRNTLQKAFLFSEILGPAMGIRDQIGPRDRLWDR